ncbi:MAG: hypothetical protein ISQ14_10435 [Verrucomicrobiae bacterium]|nr:hypothetical protein [Verrucomicrobiae bacterium]
MVRYLRAPDPTYRWQAVQNPPVENGVHELELVSQTWRGIEWRHEMLLVEPEVRRHPDAAMLLITGNRDLRRYIPYFRRLARQSGAIAAVINGVPNQPLFGGKSEDALIAFTFSEFLKSGEDDWPLLFPMVKSAIRGMDTLSAFSEGRGGATLKRFVLTGASKRGWTTWLAGPQDDRVAGIAPMVFDILNMPAQTEWAGKVWGRQSEQISDYTDADLVEGRNDPRWLQLNEWIDPFTLRRRQTMPKLLLLGTNDPYWVVDSTRHYFDELPEPKAIQQTPNQGHDIGRSRKMFTSLTAFVETTLAGDTLPRLTTRIRGGRHEPAMIEIRSSAPMRSLRAWTADSDDRDFRDARWKMTRMSPGQGHTLALYRVPMRLKGYRAVMFEATFATGSGAEYDLSTQVIVVPDLPPGEQTPTGNARRPGNEAETRRWLENLVGHHGFDIAEVESATALSEIEIRDSLEAFGIRPFDQARRTRDLKVLPFPGGWHPRIGFLDGAVDPQRETKVSVFTPWDPRSFVVVDVPEAIWSNLGLTYLAHTHVPTIWSERGIDLPKLEWSRHEDARLTIERELPNGIRFGAEVNPVGSVVEMELWLSNGTQEKLTGLRVQNCVMLKGAPEFASQVNGNKIFRSPFVACGNAAGDRWVITAWEPCHRPWGNALCPCLHSDPKFPDADPGQRVRVKGCLTFHEGVDIEAELARLRQTWFQR